MPTLKIKPSINRTAPTQKTQGRKPTRRGGKTRHEVLEAAITCISNEGYASASISRIAELAEVTWGVMQYHFGDKEGLMDAVLEFSMSQTENQFNDLYNSVLLLDSMEKKLHIAVNEGWEIFTGSYAKAATEVVINNRRDLHNNPEKEQYLTALDHRLNNLGKKIMFAVTNNKRTANPLSLVYLTTLKGFELNGMQNTEKHKDTKTRQALVSMLQAYVKENS